MDNNVEEYTENSDLQRQDVIAVIDEFSDEMASMHGRCLDIGCGPGTVTKDLILPKLPPSTILVGADISRAMVESARSYCQDEGRLEFIELDIQVAELPSEEIGQYDNVLSFYCIHWCRNTKQVFENIFKLLRPGGSGFMIILTFHDVFDAYIKMRDNSRYKAYMQDASDWMAPFQKCPNPRADVKKVLEDIGFKVLHCSNREKSFIHKDMQTFQKHMMAVNPFLDRIPDNMKDDYRMEMAEEITRRKILFESKSNQSPKEYSVLDRYRTLIVHFKKPE